MAAFAVKNQLQAIDNLAKTADKLGVTTEALAGFRHAAELTGVSTQTADMALQRFTRRLAEAAVGTGEAKGALKELGVSAAELVQKSPTEAIAEIADAMLEVDNQADRVRLSMKLFDSEGVALVNTLALGSAGLYDAAEAAEIFGLAISREAAQKVEDANDAMTRLQGANDGMWRQLTVELIKL